MEPPDLAEAWLDELLDAEERAAARARWPELAGEDEEEAVEAALQVALAYLLDRPARAFPCIAALLLLRAGIEMDAGELEGALQDYGLVVHIFGWLCGEIEALPAALALASTGGAWSPDPDLRQEAGAALRAQLESSPESYLPGLVMALVERSRAEAEAGQVGPALEGAEAAVERARWLVEAWSEECAEHLAQALLNLAARLQDAGQGGAARAAAEESVTLLRGRVGPGATAAAEDLCAALHGLASLRSDRGDPTGALAALEEAGAVAPDPAGRALALEAQADHLAQQGQLEAAAARYREALACWTRAIDDDPDHAPDLVRAQASLADCLTELGQRHAALEISDAAVAGLGALGPGQLSEAERYWVLNAAARARSDLGQPEAALRLNRSMVAALRTEEASHPHAANPALAPALVNLAADLRRCGQFQDAHAASREAVARCRAWARRDPDSATVSLAAALNQQAMDLAQLGRSREAAACLDEATALYRDLCRHNPGRHEADLAMVRVNAGGQRWQQGDLTGARSELEAAVHIYRRLAQDAPLAHGPSLATALSNLAGVLGQQEQGEAALSAIDEALALRRRLVAAEPGAFDADLALDLINHAGALFELERYAEALAASTEARERLEQPGEDADILHLAAARTNEAACLAELGRWADSLLVADIALALQQDGERRHPGLDRRGLCRAQGVRGQARLHQDQPEGALADLQTALRLLAPELARSPAGVADLLEWLGERYAEAALAAGQPVDRSLLGPPDAAEA